MNKKKLAYDAVYETLVKKIVWLPPLLFAIIPTLAVYTHNINFLSIDRVAVPLLYSVIFMVISSCVSYVIFREQERASIFTSAWLILFFSYGYIYLAFGDSQLGKVLLSLNVVLFALYGFFLLLLTKFLFSKKGSFRKLVFFLAIVALISTGFSLFTIIPSEINRFVGGKKLEHYVSQNLGSITNSGDRLVVKPDIYYIIFDRYAREDVLKKYFNFQNNDHINYLKAHGFWVGERSYANYPNTFLSLSSSLNMTYLDFLTYTLGKKQDDQVNVYRQLLQENQLSRFLKGQGYRFVMLGSSWDAFKQSKNADENDNLFNEFDEFSLFIYERTFLNTLRGVIENKQLYVGTERFNKISDNLEHRLNVIYRQREVSEPVFVFVHFLLPHPPNVFSPKCVPYTLSESSQQVPEKGYLRELQCANVVMKSLVSEIQSSGRASVIIFQSDEGPYLPLKYFNGDGESVPESFDSYFIHGAILNAVYMPDKADPFKPADYSDLSFRPNTSPVNVVRLILNYYFGTNLQILPDKTFFPKDENHVYDFKEVTDYYKGKN